MLNYFQPESYNLEEHLFYRLKNGLRLQVADTMLLLIIMLKRFLIKT